jgi:hypothetical protein
VFTLLALPESARDLSLSRLAREACIAAVTTDSATVETPGAVGAAVASRAVLPEAGVLTGAETAMLREWFDRIAAG